MKTAYNIVWENNFKFSFVKSWLYYLFSIVRKNTNCVF